MIKTVRGKSQLKASSSSYLVVYDVLSYVYSIPCIPHTSIGTCPQWLEQLFSAILSTRNSYETFVKFSHSSYCLYHERLDRSPRDSVIYAYQCGLTHERLQSLIEQLGDWEYVEELRKKAKQKLRDNNDWPPHMNDWREDVIWE